MTNSEMIQKLETDGLSSVSDMDFITNVLEENDKLKAEAEQFSNELISVRIENELLKKKNELTNYYFEQYSAAIDEIEQLKEDYSVLARQYNNVENSSIRYYNEVKQLKSKLEQSVKLPCKVGDVVYRVNGKIIQMTIESVLIKNRNGNILIRIDCIENEFKGEFSYISDNIQNDIGKRVFLTREEAEQALKVQVEE